MPGSENSSKQAFFYVYVLESLQQSHKLYIGFTNNLEKRLKEHNQGASQSTQYYLPWKIIYCEACRDILDAKRREKYLKTSQGRRFLKRRIKEYLYKKK